MKTIHVLLALLTLAVARICSAADDTDTDADTIRSGVTNSTLIVSGRFSRISAGGGGATGAAEIVDVLKAPKEFMAPKTIVVFWPSEKAPGLGGLRTNTFLLFLRPADSATPTAYRDVTGQKQPLVRASKENLRLLQLQLATFALAADKLMDDKLAAKAEVVLRAKFLSFDGADKYAVFRVQVLEVLKNESSVRFTNEVSVAAYSGKDGVPAGESTLYLERYNPTNAELWKLVGNEASTGVSHSTK